MEKRINVSININVEDEEVSIERALWNCLRGWLEIKETGEGIVTFKDGQKVYLRKNENDNLTFHIYKEEKDGEV